MITSSCDPIRVIIITVPPEEIRSHLEPLRQRLCSLGGDPRALAYPPHITLRTGAFIPRDQLQAYIHDLGASIAGMPPCPVRAQRLYLGPTDHQGCQRFICAATFAPSPDLHRLNQRLLTVSRYQKREQTSFWPHLSLVYGNLSLEGLRAVQSCLADNPEILKPEWSWSIDHVALYTLQSTHWQPLHIFHLP